MPARAAAPRSRPSATLGNITTSVQPRVQAGPHRGYVGVDAVDRHHGGDVGRHDQQEGRLAQYGEVQQAARPRPAPPSSGGGGQQQAQA